MNSFVPRYNRHICVTTNLIVTESVKSFDRSDMCEFLDYRNLKLLLRLRETFQFY